MITNTVVKRTMIFRDETTDTFAINQLKSNTYHVLFLISQVSHQFLPWPHGNSHLFHVLLATQQLPRTKRNKLTSCMQLHEPICHKKALYKHQYSLGNTDVYEQKATRMEVFCNINILKFVSGSAEILQAFNAKQVKDCFS